MIKIRFRLRTLMILVAITAFLIGIPLHWRTWLGSVEFVPISAGLNARPLRPSEADNASQTVRFEIKYNFELGTPHPPAGMFFRLRGETKIEDRASGTLVDRYTFNRLLISGVHGKSSATIPWQIKKPKPGQYRMRYEVTYMNPFGVWTKLLSGGSTYDVQILETNSEQHPK